MLEAALKKLRREVHRSKQAGACGACRLGERCDCACQVCTSDKPLLEAAVCSAEGLPRRSCVLQECDECGLDKVLMCERNERKNQQYLKGKVRLMRTVTRSVPGYDDKSKTEPVSVECTLKQVFEEMRSGYQCGNHCIGGFNFTLMHDYLAKRLAGSFHSDLYDLPLDEEVWVMDYIENFSCFEEFALQQDHYGHKSVTIFVILCFRHRRDDEHVEATYKLPGNLTAELHAFLSDDLSHDVGFAQLAMHMVMQSKESKGQLPARIRNWSDGASAHFKNFSQLLFMSEIARRYGTKWWWSFFQSCHGHSPFK